MKQNTAKGLLEMMVACLGITAVSERLRVPIAIVEDWMRLDTEIPQRRLDDVAGLLDKVQ
jgi:Trp operon repressor